MITNLFSIFDPSSYTINTAWAVILALILLTPAANWKNDSPLNPNLANILLSLNNEISAATNNNPNGETIILLILFTVIFAINVTALLPQVFSPTSHLVVTLPLSLITWLASFIFGWANNTNHALIHLVPQGTPNILIPFIVIIELVSALIRPITLCVRLTANLIAGHLLITLLGNSFISASAYSTTILIVIPLILTTLETAVAGIQAYVFITLLTLYLAEVNYNNNI